MKRLFVLTILAVVAAAGLMSASAQRGTAQPRNTTSESSDAVILHECRINLKMQAVLAADRPGILNQINHREGDPVFKDKPVAGLKSKVAQAAFDVAKKKAEDDTEIVFAKKASEHAKAGYDKAVEVNRRLPGAIPALEIKELKLAWDKAEASIKKAVMQKEILGKQMEEAQAQLDTFTITAPFDGRVRKRLKSVGEAVRQGDPILEIINTGVVFVEGKVDVRHWRRMKVGNEVLIELEVVNSTLLAGEKAVLGKLVFVGRTASPVNGKVTVKAEVVNKEEFLFPGLTARMTIRPGTQFKPPRK